MLMLKPSNHQLLRTQVYEYLRGQLRNGELRPGMFLSITHLMKELNIGRTPLRDALIQLQTDGFVTFLPQRGIRVNELSRQEIKDILEVLGALDSRVMLSVFPQIGPAEISTMREINQRMSETALQMDFYKYWELNHQFHNVYLTLSSNSQILHLLNIFRQRLFGFGEIEWSNALLDLNHSEHLKIIELLESENPGEAAGYIRDIHIRVPF
jgi:DNA-binding GntR family transcriptional regulator